MSRSRDELAGAATARLEVVPCPRCRGSLDRAEPHDVLGRLCRACGNAGWGYVESTEERCEACDGPVRATGGCAWDCEGKPALAWRPYPPTCDWCGAAGLVTKPVGEQTCSTYCRTMAELYLTDEERERLR